jgi:hypothetical protein
VALGLVRNTIQKKAYQIVLMAASYATPLMDKDIPQNTTSNMLQRNKSAE